MKKKDVKFGIIFFKDTINIGDDIQTYAQSQFLPQIDYVIERENVDSFVPANGEIVNCIMNAWWLVSRTNFPPSPYINPLPVSMHFKNTELSGPTYLSGLGMKWLKQYEPIGLRDDLVKKYLDEAGVKNYFSGCMTLTLKKNKNLKKENYVCVVDIDSKYIDYLHNKLQIEVKEVKHTVDLESNSKLSWDERKKNVESLLLMYQKSKCVITSRLHCVLPCLALEVPVLLIYDDDDQDVINRLGIYSKLCNSIKKNDLNDDIDLITKYIENPLDNPKEYLKYRIELTDKCTSFVKNAKSGVLKENLVKKYNIDHFNDIKNQANRLYRNVEILQDDCLYYKTELKKAEDYYRLLENELNQLKYKKKSKIGKILRGDRYE